MARYTYPDARDTANGKKNISIFWLRRNGYLPKNASTVKGTMQWFSNGEKTGDIQIEVETSRNPSIRFIYRVKNNYETEVSYRSKDYRFPLERIPCRFGGKRWFFRCDISMNSRYCGKRVAILYSSGDYFVCRSCANFSYDSCNESSRYRGGVFGVLARSWKIDDMEEKLKRRYYRGKPTRKYRRILRLERAIMGVNVCDLESKLLQ